MRARKWIGCIVALATYAASLAFLGEKVSVPEGELGSKIAFVAVQILVIAGLAFWFSTACRAPRFQSLSSVTLVAFVNQVALKGIWVHRQRPELLDQMGFGGFLYTHALGYLLFFPMIFALAFLGWELGRLSIRKSVAAPH